LGNVRLSYTSDRLLGVRVIEENNYYPFGLKHQGYNNISPPNSVYKYKFNGMEHQDELGLNVYDFGARNYMPDLGRWANIDPLAEQSRRWTPYNYAYNNPVYFIDPDGMESNSNSGSGGQNLSNDDFDVMVDMGYGRKMSASKIAGAVGFSGASVQLSKSGETKFAEDALKDALNGILNNDEHSIGDKNSQPKVQSKREKLKENINVTKDIGDRAEVVKALDEYIAELTNGNPNKVLGKLAKLGEL